MAQAAETESRSNASAKRARLDTECSETEIEVEPTIIDSNSENEAEIVNSNVEDQASPRLPVCVPECVKPYSHWTRMVDVVLKCDAFSKLGHQISWDLPARLGVSDSEALTHISYIVNEGLNSRTDSYKIGISYKPHDRFTKYADYKYLQRMVVACASENPATIAEFEKKAISHFGDDERCQNVSPGGESAYHGLSPFFLYVVFGRCWQFKKGREEAKRMS
jgi:hypothetical protein